MIRCRSALERLPDLTLISSFFCSSVVIQPYAFVWLPARPIRIGNGYKYTAKPETRLRKAIGIETSVISTTMIQGLYAETRRCTAASLVTSVYNRGRRQVIQCLTTFTLTLIFHS